MIRTLLLTVVLGVLCSLAPLQAALPDFTELVEANTPAVVNIEAIRMAGSRSSAPASQDPMEELFRRMMPGQMPPAARDRVSSGSGFLISEDGYVLTNHHVVDGADQIIVRLNDRRELEATLVGADPASDVALLKLEGNAYPMVRLGDSSLLKPGQWVIAIGSPFSFDSSVTAGIVSAKGRSFGQDQQYVPFIQTDVPINRGNSGGPLINMDGEVVGINSQIFSSTGGFMGLSFAIPIEVAANVAEQLKETGTVSRGLLGVGIQAVSRELAQTLGLERPGGALINNVQPDSAAAKAGIRIRDVIVEFNGQEVARHTDLPPLVGVTRPGSEAQVKLFRDGKLRTVPVVIGELPGEPAVASSSKPAASDTSNVLGIEVEELSAEQRSALGVDKGGVLVKRVTGSAARRAGVREGDVVLMVDRNDIASLRDFQRALRNIKAEDSVALLVQRGQGTSFIVISPRPGD